MKKVLNAANYEFDPKKHAKSPKGKSMTIPGQAYSIETMVRRFQTGGVVSRQMFRAAVPTGDEPDPFQSAIDITQIEAIKKEMDLKFEAKVKAQKDKEAKARLEDEKRTFDAAVQKRIDEIKAGETSQQPKPEE